MTSSTSPAIERGLDTMLLVYSLLQGHPGALPCQHFLAASSGWFTSPLVLFEAKHILTSVYGVSAHDASAKLLQFAAGPVVLLDLNAAAGPAALQLAATQNLDLTDAVLLHLASQHGAGFLATEDQRLTRACGQFGITPQSPLDPPLRQQIATWEAANLAPKGLGRVLRRIHHWLAQNYPPAAQPFWAATGSGIHLP